MWLWVKTALRFQAAHANLQTNRPLFLAYPGLPQLQFLLWSSNRPASSASAPFAPRRAQRAWDEPWGGRAVRRRTSTASRRTISPTCRRWSRRRHRRSPSAVKRRNSRGGTPAVALSWMDIVFWWRRLECEMRLGYLLEV